MSKVKGGRNSPHYYSKGLNFTKFLIIIGFILSIVGICFLSLIMNDPVSFGLGFLIGFAVLIFFYLLWKYVPPYYLKKG